MIHVLGICGSLQARSKNLTLLETAARAMPAGSELTLFDGLRDLPHFNPDLAGDDVPDGVGRWRRALDGSDAVLIATPEYGFSLPGALKNAIDWVIGSGELEGKTVAIASPRCRIPNAAAVACRRCATRCQRYARRSLAVHRFRWVRISSVRLQR